MVEWGFGPNLTRSLGVREFTMGISSGLHMDFTGLKKNRADIYCYKSRFSKYSVQFSHLVMSDSLWPHGLYNDRFPCPSPIPRAYSNSCPLSQWWRPTISSSVVPFSSCLQSFPASGSFPMGQFFASGSQVLEFQLQHPSNEHSGLISFRMDWLDLLAVQVTLKSLLKILLNRKSQLYISIPFFPNESI